MNDERECGCAQEYAARWPGMAASELALVHDPLCRVRLARMAAQRRGAARSSRR